MKKPGLSKLIAVLSALLFVMPHGVIAQITFQKEYYYSTEPQYTMAVAQNKYSNDYYFAGLSDEGTGFHHYGMIAKTDFKGVWQWAGRTDNHPAGGWTDIKALYAPGFHGNTHTGTITAGHSYYPDLGPYQSGTGFRLARMDASGNVLHYKAYTPDNTEAANYKVEQATLANGSNDGFVSAGFVKNSVNGQQNVYIVRTNEALAATWSAIFTYPGKHSRAYSVKQTADKGFIVTGYAGLPDSKIFVMKLSAAGAITWQKLYELPGGLSIGDDIIEVMNGINPEYFVLAHTTGSTGNIAILHLDQAGLVLNSKFYTLNGAQTPRGMIYLPSGHITFTAITFVGGFLVNNPILVKTDAALSTISFAKLYTNVRWASCPVLTTDNGYLIGSSKAEPASPGSEPHHLIKTDANGVSGCDETNITINISPITTITVTPGSFTASAGHPAVDVASINTVTFTENVLCKDFCRDVTTNTTHAYPHACYNQAIQLNASCPGGTTVKWFKLPDLTNDIATTPSYSPGTTTGNADYVSRCYDADGCVITETYHHLTVSSALINTSEFIPACYGQYITLNSDCGTSHTVLWTNPPGADTPTVPIEALSNQTYSVNCFDQFGCHVKTKTITVEIMSYPVVQVHPTVTICEGAPYDLDNSIPGFAMNCTWFELPNYTPVSGSVVSPTASTAYYAECRDLQGCISYHTVGIDITPAPVVGSIATYVCEGGQVVLNNFPGGGCNWTWKEVNSGVPVIGTGFQPLYSGQYRGTCVDANGCISYFDVYVDVVPWTVITQTVYAPCGQPFPFSAYSNLCEYGISSWASLVGGQYVLFPAGWAPTANITVYGFGTNVYGYCCRVELQVIVQPAEPTYHELCYKYPSPLNDYTIPFTCAPGATMQWTPSNTVTGPGVYEVTCTDNATGCIIRHAIFNIVPREDCDIHWGCYDEGTIVATGGCPQGTASVDYEKNGIPYSPFTAPNPLTAPFSAATNGPGTYTITCRDAQGNILSRKYYQLYMCDGTADKQNNNSDEPDINQNSLLATTAETLQIDLYPNPGTGVFNLRVRSAGNADYQVKVTDMLGKQVIANRTGNTANNTILDLTGYAKGVYHVQVMIDGSLHSRRIILQ